MRRRVAVAVSAAVIVLGIVGIIAVISLPKGDVESGPLPMSNGIMVFFWNGDKQQRVAKTTIAEGSYDVRVAVSGRLYRNLDWKPLPLRSLSKAYKGTDLTTFELEGLTLGLADVASFQPRWVSIDVNIVGSDSGLAKSVMTIEPEQEIKANRLYAIRLDKLDEAGHRTTIVTKLVKYEDGTFYAAAL